MRNWLLLWWLVGLGGLASAKEESPDAGYLVALERCSALTAVRAVCAVTGTSWQVVGGSIEITNDFDGAPEPVIRHYRVSPEFARAADAFDGAADGEASNLTGFMDTVGYWEEGFLPRKASFQLAVDKRLIRCDGNRSAQRWLGVVLEAFDPTAPSLLSDWPGLRGWPRLVAVEDESVVTVLRRSMITELTLVGESPREAVAKLQAVVSEAVSVRLRWIDQDPTYKTELRDPVTVTPEERERAKVLQAAMAEAAKRQPAPPDDPFAVGASSDDPFGAPGNGFADPFVAPSASAPLQEVVTSMVNDGTADAPIRSGFPFDLQLVPDSASPTQYLRYLLNSMGYRYRIVDGMVAVGDLGRGCMLGRHHVPIGVTDAFATTVGSTETAIRAFLVKRGVVFDEGDFVRYLPELGVVAFFMHVAKQDAVEQAFREAGVLAAGPEAKKWPWPAGWETVQLGEYPEEASMAEALLVLRGAFKRADGAPSFNLVWIP